MKPSTGQVLSSPPHPAAPGLKWLCWALLCWALLAFTVACGGDDPEHGGSDFTNGGEEGSGVAKSVPIEQAPATGSVTSSGVTILQPSIDAIELSPQEGPPPPPDPNAPSRWGDPEGQGGEALPGRAPLAGNAAQLYQQGLAASRSGNDAAAKQAFAGALKADPKSFQSAYALGVLADRGGQTNTALSHYRRALSLQPDYELAADAVVKLNLRSGNRDAALRFIEPLATRWVRNPYLQAIWADTLTKAGQLDKAEAVARAALRRDERSVPAMVALARASLRRGREELVESILAQAKIVDPNHPEIHFLQGQALEGEGRLAEALTSYRKAIELRPEYAEARTALGVLYLAGGNYAQAVQHLEIAARLVPMMPEAHLNLGDAYRASGRWADAKRRFDLALRMRDNLPEAHFNLGLMYMAAGDQFPGMTRMDALKRAITELNTYRGKMGSRLGRNDASETYLADLTRQVEREQKRIERQKKAAERAARQAAMDAEGGN